MLQCIKRFKVHLRYAYYMYVLPGIEPSTLGLQAQIVFSIDKQIPTPNIRWNFK